MAWTDSNDLTPTERVGFNAFIDATNEAGGINGYRRMLEVVIVQLVYDYGKGKALWILEELANLGQ